MGRSVATISSGSGIKKYPTIATYTNSQTITLPTGVTEVYAILAGGGGAGCRGVDSRFWGGGGGGGGVTTVLLDTSSTSSITIVVGAGGTANANGSGSRGGTTNLVYNGITYSARGGDGGQYTRNNGREFGGQGGPIILNANPSGFGANLVQSTNTASASAGTAGYISGGFHGMQNTEYAHGITMYSMLSGAGGGGDTGTHSGRGQDGLTGGGGTDGQTGGSSLMFGRTNGVGEMGGAGLLGTSNSNNSPYHGGGLGGGGGAAGTTPSSGGNQGGEGGAGCVILYY